MPLEHIKEIDGIGTVQLLGVFRLILAILLSIFYLADQRLWPLDPDLSIPFQIVLGLYLSFLLIATWMWRYASFQKPATVVVFSFIDIALISSICFFTDGMQSPLVFLILVSIMVHGVLMPLRSGLLLVFFSFTVMMGLWVFSISTGRMHINNLSDLLLDKVLLRIFAQTTIAGFAVVLANIWSRRINLSESRLRGQQRELESIKLLHEVIIQQVNTGILVADRNNRITFANSLIFEWFDEEDAIGMLLSDFSPVLHSCLVRWITVGVSNRYRIDSSNGDQLQVDFIPISGSLSAQTLIVIDTMEHINTKAQEGKLAALGQLTAAIAHEIRNPIAIISQAVQLLKEDIKEPSQEKLSDMILTNVNRMNKIVNDILDIARKNTSNIIQFDLISFLKNTLREFEQIRPETTGCFNIKTDKSEVLVLFDPVQFKQILWNLLGNAVQHGTVEGRVLKIVVDIHVSVVLNEVHTALYFSDNGQGFSAETIHRMFEPFFSTHHEGTGLGLYLSKELCELNNAKLEYIEHYSSGACFRITFATIAQSVMPEYHKHVPYQSPTEPVAAPITE